MNIAEPVGDVKGIDRDQVNQIYVSMTIMKEIKAGFLPLSKADTEKFKGIPVTPSRFVPGRTIVFCFKDKTRRVIALKEVPKDADNTDTIGSNNSGSLSNSGGH